MLKQSLILLSLSGLLLQVSVAVAAPLKIAFVFVGPISDGGWSQEHNLGRLAVEKEFGSKVETTYVDSVPESADAERVIRQLAAKDYGLIFTTSFGYMEPTLKVAKLFPHTRFEHATGYKTAANVITYQARFYEGAYLLGVLAGRTTKKQHVGFCRVLSDRGSNSQHQCLYARGAQRQSQDSHESGLG